MINLQREELWRQNGWRQESQEQEATDAYVFAILEKRENDDFKNKNRILNHLACMDIWKRPFRFANSIETPIIDNLPRVPVRAIALRSFLSAS